MIPGNAMPSLSTIPVQFCKTAKRPAGNSCRGVFFRSATQSLTNRAKHLKKSNFCSFGDWYRMCYTFRGYLPLDRFLHFRLVCRVTGCRRVCSSRENVRTKSQKTDLNRHDLDTKNQAGHRSGHRSSGRGSKAGYQPVYQEHGLGCILVTCYEADLAANRCLRNGAREIAPNSASARVHVIGHDQNIFASGRANCSVTFFCP